MKRKLIIFIPLLIHFSIFSDELNTSIECENSVRPEFQAKTVKLLHIESNLKPGESVQIGDPAGILSPDPSKFSDKFDMQFRKSELLYSEPRYNDTIGIFHNISVSVL